MNFDNSKLAYWQKPKVVSELSLYVTKYRKARRVKGYRIFKTTCGCSKLRIYTKQSLHPFYFVVSRRFPTLFCAGFAAMVVTVSMDNAVSLMKTKQPIRIVLLLFSPRFLLCPSPCRKRERVTTVTQLSEKMAEGSIPNKRFRDKPHSSLSCFAMRLKPGQEIRECLLSYVKENNLKAPFVLSCVGSVTSATLRLANVSKDTPNEVS